MNEDEAVPALGIEIASALGDTRQVKMTTYISRDAPKAEIDALLDKLVAAAERQEAKPKAAKLRDDIEDSERTLQNLRDDVGRLDSEHQVNLARLDVQAGYVGEELSALNARDRLVGKAAHDAENHKRTLDGLRAEREKLEAERTQHRGNIGVTISRHMQHLDKLSDKLAAAAAAAEG
jgi:chromosome segregation ATPase